MQCDVASHDADTMQKRWLASHFLCSHQGKTVYSYLQKFKQKKNKKTITPNHSLHFYGQCDWRHFTVQVYV